MILDCMLGSHFGGLEKIFLDQLEMLPTAGHSVLGLARQQSPASERAQKAGLPCATLRLYSDWDPISLARLRAFVGQARPDLALCHGRKAHRALAHAMGNTLPIAAMIHKFNFDKKLPAAAYLATAEHRRQTLIAAGLASEKIAVIPNAVRLPTKPKQDYGIASGAPLRIAALGRLHPKKGFEVLIAALERLAARNLAFTCAIAGEGPSRGALEAQIARASLDGRVSLGGWIDDVAGFLAQADVFAFPSFQEDFPLAVLDAMASGLPILSSHIDGPKEILVAGKTGVFFEPDDADGLAEGLARLAADRALRETLGRGARAEAEARYSFPAVGERLGQVLDNILAGRSAEAGL